MNMDMNNNIDGKPSSEVVEQYEGYERIQALLETQVYMEYGDYQQVRLFSQANPTIYEDERVPWSFRYQLALITAKSHYLRSSYKQSLKTIQLHLPVPPKGAPYPYKLFYERQILLLKLFYLNNPKQTYKLDLVYKEYQGQKGKCQDWPQLEPTVEIYEECLAGMWGRLGAAGDGIKKRGNGGSAVGGELGLGDWLKSVQVRCRVFQGVPVYLVSTKWLDKAIKYAQNPKQSPYPGPALSLQLINHIFQLQPHIQKNKLYLNTLLFPATESIDYLLFNKKQWQQTQQIFQGEPIKRFPIQNKVFSSLGVGDGEGKGEGKGGGKGVGDCVVRTMIEKCGLRFVFQWQAGVYWELSVLGCLREKIFGMGQLKMLIKRNNKGVSYIEQKLVENGIIQQSKNLYKYTQILPQMPQKIPSPLFTNFLTKYNLQSYESAPNPSIHSMGIIGLATNSNYYYENIRKGMSNKGRNLGMEMGIGMGMEMEMDQGLVCCLLGCVGAVCEMVGVYCGGVFVGEIKKEWSNADIQYVVSFSDLIKKMWFSSKHQPTIDPSPFLKQLHTYLSKPQNSKPSPFSTVPHPSSSSPKKPHPHNNLLAHLTTLLLPLHPSPSLPLTHSQLNPIYSEFEIMKLNGLTNFKKNNTLEIFNIFTQFRYQEYKCWYCCQGVGYRLVPGLVLEVDIQGFWEYLEVYFVRGNAGKGEEGGQTGKQLIEEGEMTLASQKLGKTVQQLNLKLPLGKNLLDIHTLLSQKPPKSPTNLNLHLNPNKSPYMTVLLNPTTCQYQQIPLHRQSQDQEIITVKMLNQIINEKNRGQGKQEEDDDGGKEKERERERQKRKNGDGQEGERDKGSKWMLFIFQVGLVGQKEQFAVVNFKNPETGKNKGYPQLIRIPGLRISLKQGQNHQKNRQIIKTSLSNPKIEIKRFEVLPNPNPKPPKQKQKQKKSLIINWINVYTHTKLGSIQRVVNSGKLGQQGEGKGGGGDGDGDEGHSVSLEDCIRRCYYCEEKEKEKQEDKLRAMKSLPVYQEKIFCHKCKKQVKCVIKTKLLQFRKTIIITINRYKQDQPQRIPTSITFPLTLTPRQFLPQQSTSPSPSQSKKKSPQYYLKSLLLYESPLFPDPSSTKLRPKYSTVIQSPADQKWYKIQNQGEDGRREVGIGAVDGRRVDMLVYCRGKGSVEGV